MIRGIGVDVVEVARMARLWNERRDAFETKVFTPQEVRYCLAKATPETHLAARFAAKEAGLKALGTGWAGGISLQDVEVIKLEGGAPMLAFRNKAAEVAQKLGVQRSHLSLSHDGGIAVAYVVLEGELGAGAALSARTKAQRPAKKSGRAKSLFGDHA